MIIVNNLMPWYHSFQVLGSKYNLAFSVAALGLTDPNAATKCHKAKWF